MSHTEPCSGEGFARDFISMILCDLSSVFCAFYTLFYSFQKTLSYRNFIFLSTWFFSLFSNWPHIYCCWFYSVQFICLCFSLRVTPLCRSHAVEDKVLLVRACAHKNRIERYTCMHSVVHMNNGWPLKIYYESILHEDGKESEPRANQASYCIWKIYKFFHIFMVAKTEKKNTHTQQTSAYRLAKCECSIDSRSRKRFWEANARIKHTISASAMKMTRETRT